MLFVCTGNLCRSPFAEILTRHLLADRLGPEVASRFDVASAGVRAAAGAPMHPDTRRQLAPWGLDGAAAERFVARRLEPAMLEAADLVLGSTVEHRSAIVQMTPHALPITFSLREFARLAASVDQARLPPDPVDRARALVGEARSRRGMVAPTGPDADQIADPIGRGAQAHQQAAALIRDALATIVDVIAPQR